jgi:hypothetical protein
MPRQILVECPVCKRRQTISALSGGAWCDCHLYCSKGDRPIDCSTTSVNWSGQLGWPAGAHQNSVQEGDDVRHRVRYCATHDLYIYKTPVFLEVDMSFFERRLPKKYTVFPKR